MLALTLAAVLASCAPHAAPGAATGPVTAAASGCAAPGGAFLNARLRGAIDADLVWNAAELQCEGGSRPDGNGIRVSLAGPLDASGRRLRLVFGMAAAPGSASSRAVPTNVTLIVEGAERVYATLGDDKCSVDQLAQQPAAGAGATGDYWVTARGFCFAPASTLDNRERVLLSRFDFRGRIHLEDRMPPAHATTT